MEEPFQIPIGQDKKKRGLLTILHDFFLVNKMGGPVGLLIFIGAAVFFGYIAALCAKPSDKG